MLCSNYMEKSYWYSIPSLTAHRYKLHTFRELTKRCMKNTYAILLELGALDEPHLNLIFVDRLADLLPEQYFYRVVSGRRERERERERGRGGVVREWKEEVRQCSHRVVGEGGEGRQAVRCCGSTDITS